MRKIFLLRFAVILLLFSGLTTNSFAQFGWIKVKKNRVKYIPNGMSSIPSGRTYIGVPRDIMDTLSSPSRMVSVSAFFMDETEVSNAQYRKFVNWVRDSIAVTTLGPAAAPNLFKPVSSTKGGATLTSQREIDWKKVKKYLWRKGKDGYASKLAFMYYSGDDALLGKPEIDIRKLKYSFSLVNLDLAAASKNDPAKNRKDFIQSYVDEPDPHKPNEFPSIAVYPDTLVWKVDFAYSQNEPMVLDYFSNPAYDDYPVVGVTWEQANAYCVWRSRIDQPSRVSKRHPKLEFRLPTAAEFEYAAKAGDENAKYPWTGPFVRNGKGRLQANFKNGSGNYTPDRGFYTVNVRSYSPNNNQLYNLAGNVAEWTSTAYNPSSAALLHDFNPNFSFVARPSDNKYMKRKVVKGGSWKDIAYFLQNSVSTYEYQDQARSYIGFRCVASYPGAKVQ